MKQLKVRIKRHMFWVGLVSLLLMLVDNIFYSYFGIELSRQLNQLEQTICIVLSILVFLGILNNQADKKIADNKLELSPVRSRNKA